MEPRAAIHRSGALLLLAAILAAAVTSASAIGDKCAACKAVAVSFLLSSPFSAPIIGAPYSVCLANVLR
jgi:hypothetical protein